MIIEKGWPSLTDNQKPKTNGIKIENAAHLLMMWTPNVLNPHKAIENLKHPIYEVFHTKHKQYPIGEGSLFIVEHILFNHLVTVDVVERSTFAEGGCNPKNKTAI